MTFTAAFAIFDIASNPHRAIVKLQAVRHQEQDLIRCGFYLLGQYQLIINFYERLLHPSFTDAEQPPHPNEQGKNDLDNYAPQLF